MLFYLIKKEDKENKNWKTRSYCDVAPRLVTKGAYVGKYIVNVNIFKSDPSFEEVRNDLEKCEIVDIPMEDLKEQEIL